MQKTFDTLLEDMNFARDENFHFGFKLVRGAYMDEVKKTHIS